MKKKSRAKYSRQQFNKMPKPNLRAQAALEFLTTYGWAFLVILIMIGALAYFGILSPGKVLSDRCNFGVEFACVDFQVSATANTFKIRLKNSIGQPLDVSSITLGSESVTQYTCTTPPTLPTGWKAGEIKDLDWSVCNSALAGILPDEKAKVLVTIKYFTSVSGATYTKEVKGEGYVTAV